MSNRQPEREPSAGMRTMAKQLREMYLALAREGFSAAEALAVIGHVIRGAQDGGQR